MGSTLLVLRTLLEDQLDTGTTSGTTDPTETLLNTYINKAIRKIVRRDTPRELLNADAISANIVAGANTVTLPATILVPLTVYYKFTGGAFRQLRNKPIKKLIDFESPNNYFNSTNQGDPNYWTLRGTSLVFNKQASRTEANAIKIMGVAPPSTLSADVDTTELPIDYDLLVSYEAAVLFYQRDDDVVNQQKYQQLAIFERAELKLSLDSNEEDQIDLDPYVFQYNQVDIANPNIFFGST